MSESNDTKCLNNVARSDEKSAINSLELLAAKLIQEKRTSRRWGIFFKLCWFFLVAATLFLLSQNEQDFGESHPHTAIIRINGVIAADSPANAEDLIKALQNAFESSASKAVVLVIDSPGGSPVQASIINETIVRLKRLYPKPIYTVVGDTCTSAAYYVAVATDKIYANKSSVLGSIGVRLDSFGFTRAMKALGVERRLFVAGEHKDILDPFSPMTEWDTEKIDSMLKEIHGQFIAAVKSGRDGRLKLDTLDLFSGAFWSGERAEKIGVIDGFGDLGFVTRALIKQGNVVDYTLEENVAERLVKRFGAAVGNAAVRALQGWGQWH